jgi:predicted translin family RNA/ssDNA-binding protein
MEKMFSRLRKDIEENDETREKLIIKSRPIIKSSKLAIYAIHRGNIKEAEALIKESKKNIDELRKLNSSTGAYDAALQEYAEAASYLNYVKTGKLVSDKELDIDAENYLLGICDLTGELARRAVFSVVNEDFQEVSRIHKFVSEISEEFLKFDFRNGELRKKSDSIKWNLKKIEEILYELKLRDKL